jgi:hypothetical protein
MPAPDDLSIRLAAMEQRVPAALAPGRARAAWRRWAASVATAPIAVLLAAATVTAGGIVVAGLVTAAPGVENPGQPLAGAALECMTPPDAAAYLAARGFTRVTWQIETGDATGKGGTTTIVTTAPQHGYVVPGSIVDGTLLMVVDQRAGAVGSGACVGEPMP